jgi:hypothetical protein
MAVNRIGLVSEIDNLSSYPKKHNARELKLAQDILKSKEVDDSFEQQPVISTANSADGTALPAEAAAAAVIAMNSGRAPYELYYAAVESTGTAVYKFPRVSADGLELPMDDDQTDGPTAIELTHGTTARSRCAFTVGTDEDFFCQATLTIDDISDVTELWFGFRKAEAYQADPDNYDELACVNVGLGADGRFNITKILNNAATSTTNTGATAWADGESHTLKVVVRKSGRCEFYVDGTQYTAAAHTFDSTEVVVPFLHLDGETGDAGVSISSWRVGKL